MWLKDLLPDDLKGVRIMSYGYNSSLIGNDRTESRLIEYKRNFITQLENSRSLVLVCEPLCTRPVTRFSNP